MVYLAQLRPVYRQLAAYDRRFSIWFYQLSQDANAKEVTKMGEPAPLV